MGRDRGCGDVSDTDRILLLALHDGLEFRRGDVLRLSASCIRVSTVFVVGCFGDFLAAMSAASFYESNLSGFFRAFVSSEARRRSTFFTSSAAGKLRTDAPTEKRSSDSLVVGNMLV